MYDPNQTYFAFFKPYGVLSQFTREIEEHITLKDFGPFPSDVYPVGRLDKDTEGLLLLTDDASVNEELLHPSNEHPKTYWAQLDKNITRDAMAQMRSGVDIRVDKKRYRTRPAKVRRLIDPDVPDRDPPIRYRKNIPTSWIEISITEGKNRQIRRMGAAVGFPVRRLIRVQIGSFNLWNSGLGIGQARELEEWELDLFFNSSG